MERVEDELEELKRGRDNSFHDEGAMMISYILCRSAVGAILASSCFAG